MVKTYSFSDIAMTLSHPDLGEFSTNGMGMGTITINMRTDRTQVDVASDGTPMVSKIKDMTSTLAIQVQQISDLHTQMHHWFNYLETAETSAWAQIKCIIKSPTTGEQFNMTDGSMVKHADVSFDKAAGNVTWNFIFANTTIDVI